MGMQEKKVSREKTRGNFETRAALEFYIADRARCGVQIKEICYNAGVSRTVVDGILVEHKVTDKERLKVSKDMIKVYKAEIEHLRAELKKSNEENTKLKATLKVWPDESRIDIIGPNGNNGEHYGFGDFAPL